MSERPTSLAVGFLNLLPSLPRDALVNGYTATAPLDKITEIKDKIY